MALIQCFFRSRRDVSERVLSTTLRFLPVPYHGIMKTETEPDDLVGESIAMQPRSGPPWTITVTAVLKRTDDRVVVTDSGRSR